MLNSDLSEFRFCGVKFSTGNPKTVSAFIQKVAQDPKCFTSIRLLNSYSIVLARKNLLYLRSLNDAGVNLPDGSPVARLANFCFSGLTFRVHQVRGPSLFKKTLENTNLNISHFLIGGQTLQLEKIIQKARRVNPNLDIKGFYAPPMISNSDEMTRFLLDNVDPRESQLIWLSLGTPKQDLVGFDLSSKWRKTVIGVGAAFDFYSGDKREAPGLIQNLNLEWLFRFITEPRRLWKRYLVGNFEFLFFWLSCISSDRRWNRNNAK
jgi:N-acetylglucosaminyldiphosphoundecaprenol N-acetyl-beta-D-mannosaminyltransferase